MQYQILAIGDVVGQNGVQFLKKNLCAVKKHYGIHFAVVNGENGAFSVNIEKLSWNVLRFKY